MIPTNVQAVRNHYLEESKAHDWAQYISSTRKSQQTWRGRSLSAPGQTQLWPALQPPELKDSRWTVGGF